MLDIQADGQIFNHHALSAEIWLHETIFMFFWSAFLNHHDPIIYFPY